MTAHPTCLSRISWGKKSWLVGFRKSAAAPKAASSAWQNRKAVKVQFCAVSGPRPLALDRRQSGLLSRIPSGDILQLPSFLPSSGLSIEPPLCFLVRFFKGDRIQSWRSMPPHVSASAQRFPYIQGTKCVILEQ